MRVHVSEKHQCAFYYGAAEKTLHSPTKLLFPVILDFHDDTQRHQDAIEAALKLDLQNLSQVRDFVFHSLDNRLATINWALERGILCDRSFICTAMECGLVGDALIVTQQPPTNELFDNIEFRALDGLLHRIFYQKYSYKHHFAEELFCDKNQVITRLLDRQLRQNSNVVLDIDLDFFTYDEDNNGQTNALTFEEEDFKDIFFGNSWIWKVIKKTKLLTISTEPYWSGSVENSERVYELLRKYLKNDELPPFRNIKYFTE